MNRCQFCFSLSYIKNINNINITAIKKKIFQDMLTFYRALLEMKTFSKRCIYKKDIRKIHIDLTFSWNINNTHISIQQYNDDMIMLFIYIYNTIYNIHNKYNMYQSPEATRFRSLSLTKEKTDSRAELLSD